MDWLADALSPPWLPVDVAKKEPEDEPHKLPSLTELKRSNGFSNDASVIYSMAPDRSKLNEYSLQEEKSPVYVWCPPEREDELNKLLGDMNVEILPYEAKDLHMREKILNAKKGEAEIKVEAATPCESGDMQEPQDQKSVKKGGDESTYYENFYNNYGIDWRRRGCP